MNKTDKKIFRRNKPEQQNLEVKEETPSIFFQNAEGETYKEKIQFLLNKYYMKSRKVLTAFFKWLFFATITGIVVGGFSSLFAKCMIFVTDFRTENDWIVYFLPFAGVIIVFSYRLFKYKNDKGTNLVLSMIHAKNEIPFKMAPLIFTSTLITHLFGGSAGREGAALQLGGSIGNQLGRWFHFDEEDTRVVVMCGMSAAFSALFGTPLAAVIFAMEVGSVGVMYYAALFPCVISSLLASQFAATIGIHPEAFKILSIPKVDLPAMLWIMLLSTLCAILSILFCVILHKTGDIFRKYLKNPYIRIMFAACMILFLTQLIGTKDYMGAGIPMIEKAIHGDTSPFSFLFKIMFTALTLESGFKGGEIVPSFFIGATFGCAFGNLFGFAPSLSAAVGMIAVFCGVTNCPITSIIISFELFGYVGVPYFVLAVAVSYLMSGYYGLYHDQKIMYSKYKTKYINRHTRE